MNLIKTFPVKLAGKLKYFYSVIGDVDQMRETVHRNLPDGTLELIFNLGDPVLKSTDGLSWTPGPPAMVTGLYHQRSFIKYTGKIHLVGAVFLPGYASQFVNDSLENFCQCLYSADSIFTNSLNLVNDKLYELDSETQKHRLLEEFLGNRFRKIHSTYDLERITSAVRIIQEHKGDITIPFLCKSVFMSERNFRRKYHELVGLSAKQYANIIRVKSLVKIHKLKGSSFMDLVYDLGYVDQSHLINNFKLIAGIPPKEYFASTNPVDNLFIRSPQH